MSGKVEAGEAGREGKWYGVCVMSRIPRQRAPRAEFSKGWGRIRQVSESSLVAHWGGTRKTGGHKPMSEATETSLAFRYGDPGTGMCWWLWDSQSVQGSPLLCIPLGIVHPYAFPLNIF